MKLRSTNKQLQDDFFQGELRKAICLKAENQVAEFTDCRNLSQHLNLLGIPISAHTIARFFGVLTSDHRPYTSTLDLFSRFIGFDTYSKFCAAVSENFESALFSPKKAFATGDYSFVALELAIAQNDWQTLTDLLESVDRNDPFTYELVMYLGNAVRKHPQKKEFLHALSQSDSGRWFFYECFVDEDDEDNYYSEALLAYYSKSPIPLGNQIFIKCFLAVKSIYAGKPIAAKDVHWIQLEGITFNQLHFHEISRVLELRILLDYLNKTLNKTLTNHLDFICEISAPLPHFDACWILARAIRALSYSEMFRVAFTYTPFRDTFLQRFHENPTRIHSIGELMIQYLGHSYFLKEKKERFNLPPIKLSYRHDNETKTRILIESATALLYAQEPVKKLLEKNLTSFAQSTHQTWINALIF